MHPPVRPPPSGHRFLRPALVGRRRVAWRASCCGLPTCSGIGMGLSISYGIIQKHGGTLSISSTHGLGSCFAIRLPLTSKGETGASER